MRNIILGYILFLVGMTFFTTIGNAQMRQVHVDMISTNNEISKISFYSASEGYIASNDNSGNWVGFTADSGRTITKRYITISNVDYASYTVNFPFVLRGVKAFNQDTIIAYGGFNLTPSILYSTDGGLTYLLVFHSQYGPTYIGHVYDMLFPQNSNIGFAVDGYRILKTTNKGRNWSVSTSDNTGPFGGLDAIDNNNVFAFSDFLSGTSGKLYKTSNSGSTWQQIFVPGSNIKSVDFLTTSKGWISIENGEGLLLYYTSNGGTSWTKKNDAEASPVSFYEMRVVNDSTGYAIRGGYETYITSDTGRVWEPLPRDNNFSYLGFGHNDIQVLNQNQVWSGGGRDFLELTTNGGGTPLPRSYFKIDTAGVSVSNLVNLRNFSKRNYSYKWYRNGTLISNIYNASYIRSLTVYEDTIKLVVSNGLMSDSTIHYQNFASPVTITSFSPTSAAPGFVVSISGTNFTGATSVTFGGVPAASFTVQSANSIQATVGTGASGSLKVVAPAGIGLRPGFIFLPLPVITSFTPTVAGPGDTVIIIGSNLYDISNVKFGVTSAYSFTLVNSTTIKAVVSGGSSGAVSVITSSHGTGTLAGFTYMPPPGVTSISPNLTGPGVAVSITGANFSGATSVKFGNVAASSFIVNSPTNITAIVGNGATGQVSVETEWGTGYISGFYFTSLPIIHLVSPSSGPVGSTITITGANFDVSASGNTVYFGPVKATIISATPNDLTVIVPVGASSGYITVSLNNKVATSPLEFHVTFPGENLFTANSFGGRIDIASGEGTRGVITADFDEDGKADIGTVNTLGYTLSVLRNTSGPGSISFAPKVDYSTGTFKPARLTTADVDGDGKYDILVLGQHPTVSNGIGRVIIFRNNSTPGAISFEIPVEIGVGQGPSDFVTGDFNDDGKIDLAVANSNEQKIYTYENSTVGTSISYILRQQVNVSYTQFSASLSGMATGDFDGNGQMDIVIGRFNGVYFTLLKNDVQWPSMSFTVSYLSGWSYNSQDVATSDLDNDGKADVITTNSISRNTTNELIPSINFDEEISISGIGSRGSVGDLNGDGKMDFMKTNPASASVGVVRNSSFPGTIAMTVDANYGAGTTPSATAIADFDLDQRPDIVVANMGSNNISILKNQVAFTGPVLYSFYPLIGRAGTVVTIKGINLIGSSGVSFGGIAAASFTVANDSIIYAVVDSGATGQVEVVKSGYTAAWPGFTFITGPIQQYELRMCPQSSMALTSSVSGNTYQWQVDMGAGFADILDNANYSGSTGSSMQVLVPPTSWRGNMYRCKITGVVGVSYSEVYRLRFETIWTGSSSNNWANSGNWGCGVGPDEYTDVIIPANVTNTPTLTNNTSCRSVYLHPGAMFVINPGIVLDIKGPN